MIHNNFYKPIVPISFFRFHEIVGAKKGIRIENLAKCFGERESLVNVIEGASFAVDKYV